MPPNDMGGRGWLPAITPTPQAYEKTLGLKGNPFKRLAPLDPKEATLLFVKQEQDRLLLAMIAEAISGSGSTFVALTGPKGCGRTHRLMVMQDFIARADGSPMYFDISLTSGSGLIDQLVRVAVQRSGSITRAMKKAVLGYKDVIPEEELAEIRTSPVRVGEVVLDTLVGKKPSALLLDEVHVALQLDDYWRFIFFESIREIVSSIPEGIFVAISLSNGAFDAIDKNFPALTSRLHHRFHIPALTDEEASDMVEKRLKAYSARRKHESLIDRELMAEMNRLAGGNPRSLLRLLSRSTDLAVLLNRRKITKEIFDQIMKPRLLAMEYVKSAPEGFRRELSVIVEEFDGGPVEPDILANEMEIATKEEITRLEAMVIAGLIEKDRVGRYFVHPDRLVELEERRTGRKPRRPSRGRLERRRRKRLG